MQALVSSGRQLSQDILLTDTPVLPEQHHASSAAPLVTVGVPCYNRPALLRRALSCLLEQTYRNLDIIVSDNCSPDDQVREVVEDFAAHDSRIRYFRQKENIGLTANHNFVLNQARGEFFMWVHDDDVIPAEYIEKCVLHSQDAPDIQVVGARGDRYLDDRFWYSYETWSNVAQPCHLRLRGLIKLAFVAPYCFEQYTYGLFRTRTLQKHPLSGEFDQLFRIFFAMAEEGYIHVAHEATMRKNTTKEELKKHAKADFILKRNRWLRMLPRRLEESVALARGMNRVVTRSARLSVAQKLRLKCLCAGCCLWQGLARPLVNRTIRGLTGVDLRDPREGKTFT